MGTRIDAGYCFTDEGKRSEWAETCSLTSQQNLQITKGSLKPHFGIIRKRKIYESMTYSKINH